MKRIKTFFWNILIYFFPIVGTIKLERLYNKPGNEMWRFGGGYNEYKKYFRIDWHNRGWRWTVPVDYYNDFWDRLYPNLPQHGQNLCNELIVKIRIEGVESPESHVHISVVRDGGMVARERVDLWPKVWAEAMRITRD